jgi:hypothetical protein
MRHVANGGAEEKRQRLKKTGVIPKKAWSTEARACRTGARQNAEKATRLTETGTVMQQTGPEKAADENQDQRPIALDRNMPGL